MLFSIVDTLIQFQCDYSMFLPEAGDFLCPDQHTKQSPDCIVRPLFQKSVWYGVQFDSADAYTGAMQCNGSVLLYNTNLTEFALYRSRADDSQSLLLMALYSYLSTHQTLLLHSSLVDFQGNGILFIGPSGIGKTTQAELWNRFLGAKILNGDLVFIRKYSQEFYGYGSPWHGSSPYFLNTKVKLTAIIVLSQALENKLYRLSGMDAMRGIMEEIYFPRWYPEGQSQCLSTLDALLTRIPVYHLACRPDEKSVQLLKTELLG